MTDHWSQWKANAALGIQFVVQLRLFSPTLTPRLLCLSPTLQELTSPFLSPAAELSSRFHLSLSQQDGQMLWRADWQEQTWLDKLVIIDNYPPTSPSILLCHSHFLCHPFISYNLSSTPFLCCRPSSPCAPAFSLCITYSLAAVGAGVLEAACGLRSHLILSRAKPSFRKAS